MKRREFITLLGGAAAWPVAARAQQRAMPVIGFLRSTSLPMLRIRDGVSPGLEETGYVEGRTSRSNTGRAEDHHDRLPDFAAGLDLPSGRFDRREPQMRPCGQG